MARTATKSTDEEFVDAVETMNEEEKVTKKTVKAEPLNDSDEIEVISLIRNVSYKDSKTLDMYDWDDVGHVEYMSFETLKNMWRSHKGYFKNMWLKPNDDRVINKFGLTKTFEKYEYLMNGANYTKKNINSICDAISNTPNGLKIAICDKVKSMVIDGEVTDVSVIRVLENRLKIDLIDFL
jgi:hypothetical protein